MIDAKSPGLNNPIIWIVKRQYVLPADCYTIQEIRRLLDRYWPHPYEGGMEWNATHINHNDIAWMAKVLPYVQHELIEGRVRIGLVPMERLGRLLEKIEHGLLIKKFGRIIRQKAPTRTPTMFYRGNVKFLMTGRAVVTVDRPMGPSPGLMGFPNVFKTGKGLK